MNIPIWTGTSTFSPGDTPFGFYDTDLQFQNDIDKFAIFAARRLGYPIVDIELQDLNFYAAFEEAVTTYGNEMFAYQAAQKFEIGTRVHIVCDGTIYHITAICPCDVADVSTT